MNCAYCDTEVKDIDEFNLHCLKFHPDKTGLGSFREDRTARLWDTALQLTSIKYANQQAAKWRSNYQILETFKYFLREVMKSE
jgi:hypothetical protein